MKKIIFIMAMLFCPSLFAATLTPNTVPYVCQGGTSPQLCNSNINTDGNGNLLSTAVPNNIQVFTSNGTWVKPAGISKVYVKVWGGGGGAYGKADGFAASGCGGGYSEGTTAVAGNVTVTVGGPGFTGNNGPGTNGGTSSFAGTTTIQATGGNSPSSSTGVCLGGVGSGGALNINGSPNENTDYQTIVDVGGSCYGFAGNRFNPGAYCTGAPSGNNLTNSGGGLVIVYY